MASDLWTYREEVAATQPRIEGFAVDATDGHIGTIDDATYDVGESYIVVDTGFWIFGKRRLIPASAIATIHLEEGRVTLSLSKEQVRDAPDYEEEWFRDDPSARNELAGYYGQFPLM